MRIYRETVASKRICFNSQLDGKQQEQLWNQINCCQLFLKGFVAEGGTDSSIKATRPLFSQSIVISDGHQEATKAEKSEK